MQSLNSLHKDSTSILAHMLCLVQQYKMYDRTCVGTGAALLITQSKSKTASHSGTHSPQSSMPIHLIKNRRLCSCTADMSDAPMCVGWGCYIELIK